jgi:TolB-like protein/Flp pilus assembly protein TadD
MIFKFGDHALDTERRELRRSGERIALEPQVFDLLVYLLRNRDRVVGKDDLINGIWGGRAVSDSALTTRLNAARRAVNDSGAVQSVIRTIARKGLRFVAEVEEEGAPGPTVAAVPSLALRDKPSIAVLPFVNLSGDASQDNLVDGVVEEIITTLGRIRWLFVIARNSSFAYKGRAVDVKRIGRELDVRYVLEGAVRKAGDRVRITVQLIDTTNRAHLWADRFDGCLEDVFGLQDNVAASIADVIEPALQAAETVRSTGRPTNAFEAHDCYERALAAFQPMTKEAILVALRLAEQAIAADQHHGPALALAAACHMQFANYGLTEDLETVRRKAVNLARRALQVARDDAGVVASAAMVLAVFGENIGAMTALVDDVLALDPSCARGWYHSGFLKLMTGKTDQAIELAEVSLGLSRPAQTSAAHTLIGASHFVSWHFDEALAALLLALEETPNLPVPYRYLAACYAHMGRVEDARDVVRRLREITPSVLPPDIMYLRDAEHRALYLSGLHLASGA